MRLRADASRLMTGVGANRPVPTLLMAGLIAMTGLMADGRVMLRISAIARDAMLL
jgi:hypothetical protein